MGCACHVQMYIEYMGCGVHRCMDVWGYVDSTVLSLASLLSDKLEV